MATSQVTEAGRGSAECLIVQGTDSEIDLDTLNCACNSISSESCMCQEKYNKILFIW